ncbi:MAG: carboxypeptidase-like regulatory domain-containing protein [Ferruginibacter sp.]|nr:carboxypeptidase-like regulatory domain-containing protein [Ferruginibacter sp.]
MQNFKFTFSIIISLLFYHFSWAQSFIVTGIIKDAHTQEPISFASVYNTTTGRGQVSDSAGMFTIRINDIKTDSIAITYIGYDEEKIAATFLNDTTALIVLMNHTKKSSDVVVKTKINRGLYLWKKIMTKKESYDRHNLENYAYEAYNKLEVDVNNFNVDKIKKSVILKPLSFIVKPFTDVVGAEGFVPAYLTESLSDYAYQRNPKRYFENIKASNTKGFSNESIGKLLGVMKQNVNIYNNYINVVDRDFIGPFHENADKYYSFSVPDTQIVNNNKIFHFVFKPKRPGQNTFEGDAWVTARTFQIQKITLYIGKEANINYIDKISIFQEFAQLNDSLVFLVRDKFYTDFRILGKKSLTLTGRKSTSYKNIVVNSDTLTSYFKTQKVEEYQTTAENFTQKGDAAWNDLRHDTLSTHEKAIYKSVDDFFNGPKYKKIHDLTKFLISGNIEIGNISIGKWYSLLGGNNWEGTRFQLDLGTNTGFNKTLYLHGYLAYGTKDKAYKGMAEALWIVQKKKPGWSSIHAAYKDDIDQGINQYGEVSTDNLFSLAIRKPNSTRKFLNIKEFQVDYYKEWGKGFSTDVFVTKKQFTPLQNLPSKTNYLSTNGKPLENTELAIKLRFAYLEQFIVGDFYRYTTGTSFPIIELLFAKGMSGIFNSAYNYTKYNATIKDVVKISPYGTITYKAYAGKVNGTLPFVFLENHPGNDLYYYNSNTFNLMYRFEYISDRYAGLNFEHNVGSGLFRFIPLTRKMKLRQFWNVKTLWGSMSDNNKTLNNTNIYFKTLNGSNYTEIGTGIENILRVLRVDFVWRIMPTPLPPKGISKFGIFGSFKINL